MNPPGVVHLAQPVVQKQLRELLWSLGGCACRRQPNRRPARTEPSRHPDTESDWALDILCRYRRWQPDLQCGRPEGGNSPNPPSLRVEKRRSTRPSSREASQSALRNSAPRSQTNSIYAFHAGTLLFESRMVGADSRGVIRNEGRSAETNGLSNGLPSP